MNIKQLFCKHCYQEIELNIPVHEPNWEPIRWGQIFKCNKCNKIISFISKRKIKIIKGEKGNEC